MSEANNYLYVIKGLGHYSWYAPYIYRYKIKKETEKYFMVYERSGITKIAKSNLTCVDLLSAKKVIIDIANQYLERAQKQKENILKFLETKEVSYHEIPINNTYNTKEIRL